MNVFSVTSTTPPSPTPPPLTLDYGLAYVHGSMRTGFINGSVLCGLLSKPLLEDAGVSQSLLEDARVSHPLLEDAEVSQPLLVGAWVSQPLLEDAWVSWGAMWCLS